MSKTTQSVTKSDQYIQTTIFDAISLSREKKSDFSGFSKKMYQYSFIELCKMLINNKLTIEEYKDLLHTLLENYRKEIFYV